MAERVKVPKSNSAATSLVDTRGRHHQPWSNCSLHYHSLPHHSYLNWGQHKIELRPNFSHKLYKFRFSLSQNQAKSLTQDLWNLPAKVLIFLNSTEKARFLDFALESKIGSTFALIRATGLRPAGQKGLQVTYWFCNLWSLETYPAVTDILKTHKALAFFFYCSRYRLKLRVRMYLFSE